MKEPRLSLTYPLWKPQLPAHRLVVIYRTLSEVWSHYLTPYSPRTEAWAVVRAWCDYNESILKAIEKSDLPCLVLRYDALMDDQSEFMRLERFVNRSLEDVRSPSKYRSKAKNNAGLTIVSAIRRLMGQSQPNEIASRLECVRQNQLTD